jgi:Ca-activated chloride channel family protein
VVIAPIEIATAAACALALLGELLHARRCRRIARLAFGPRGAPRAWVRLAPLLRVVAFGATTWGLATLWSLPPRVHREGAVSDAEYQHLLVVLDVSPSMRLVDAGPTGEQSRSQRARDLLDSLFQRVPLGKYRISVIAVYNGAKPVVIDTVDSDVVHNILTDLPMHYAFPVGQTRLFAGLEEAARIAKPWAPRSALLVLISDGDTVPATGMPAMPVSVHGALVVGVGDPLTGRFIDGRQSRQDATTLRQIAVRLGGEYHDGNRHHLPTDMVRAFAAGAAGTDTDKWTRREYALLAVAAGSALLALLPLLLHHFGTSWRPGVRPAAAGRGGVSSRTVASEPAGVR